MRPCHCDRIPAAGKKYDHRQHCALCTHWHRTPKYRLAWEGTPPVVDRRQECKEHVEGVARAALREIRSGRVPKGARVAEKPPRPKGGPGTELMALLASLGIQSKPGCDCRWKAEAMDRWGVEGCRANRETIVGWLRKGQQRWGWAATLYAAARAVAGGVAFRLNPLDVCGSLADEAIRRAEQNPPA